MVGLLVTGGIVLVLLILFLIFVPLGLWISSMAAGVRVSVFNLIGMRLTVNSERTGTIRTFIV